MGSDVDINENFSVLGDLFELPGLEDSTKCQSRTGVDMNLGVVIEDDTIQSGLPDKATGVVKWWKAFRYFLLNFITMVVTVICSIWSSVKKHSFISGAGSLVSGSQALVIQASVYGRNLRLLVDTGSQVSIIASQIFNTWNSPPEIEKCDVNLMTVGNDRVPVTGCASLDIQYLDGVWKVPWLIAPISTKFGVDGILGMDAMMIMDTTIVVSKNDLQLIVHTNSVIIDDDIRLEPGEVTVVPVQIDVNKHDYPVGIIEPFSELCDQGVLAPRVVVNTTDMMCSVICNVTDKPITLVAGKVIGTWAPVSISEAEEVSAFSVSACPEAKDLPGHLVELYENSKHELDEEQRQQFRQLLVQFQHVFAKSSSDLGLTDLVRHRIDVGDSRPVKQPPRRFPFAKRKMEEDEIARMLELGVIMPSASPWASPVVMVTKKDGSCRFCLDLRMLNQKTRKDAFPLPRISDCIDCLQGAKYFCTMDLQSGYWQVPMHPDDIEKTAFVTQSGLFAFRVMPFGLCNAGATFQRLMTQVLRNLQWKECLVYLDDIVTFGRSFTETLERLKHVFQRLQVAGLKLKPSKCTLFATEVSFLGHIVSETGVQMQPSKIQAVKDWPVPKSTKEVRAFLGLCGYYRRFVKDFSKIARPLSQLTSVNVKFSWDDNCQSSFENLKHALISAPILGYPKDEGQIIVDTDCSGEALGAVLSQVQNDKEVVLAYLSKCLNSAERNYCITRKELLALVTAVKTWYPYLAGRNVIARTDNSAVAWVKRLKNPTGQTARWLEQLECMNITEIHRPGRVHWNADALSRRPHPECKQCHRTDGACVYFSGGPNIHESAFCAALCSPVSTRQSSNQPANMTKDAVAESDLLVVTKWPNEEVRAEQLADPDIALILDAVETGQRPPWEVVSSESMALKSLWAMWDRLILQNGVLYRKFDDRSGNIQSFQLIVPATRRLFLLQQAHDSPLGGHLGGAKTLQKLQDFYWINMRHEVEDYCRRCDACVARKPRVKHQRAPMKPYLVCSPMERVCTDILGPFPRSSNGNKYVLVITDSFTKFTEAFPLRNIEAKTVAKVLVENWVCRYGTMRLLHSDQGTQFQSSLLQEVCRLLNIHKTRTTAWRPKANGQAERYMRTLSAMISIYTNDQQRTWDKHLPFITAAYRCARHESTGFTPNMMLFGRENSMPWHLLDNKPETPEEMTAEDYVAVLKQVFQKAHTVARRHLKTALVSRKRRYDVGTSQIRLKLNQPVWLYDRSIKPGKSPKLTAPWKKGWAITKVIDDITYRISRSPVGPHRIVHIDRLLPYEGRQPSSEQN